MNVVNNVTQNSVSQLLNEATFASRKADGDWFGLPSDLDATIESICEGCGEEDAANVRNVVVQLRRMLARANEFLNRTDIDDDDRANFLSAHFMGLSNEADNIEISSSASAHIGAISTLLHAARCPIPNMREEMLKELLNSDAKIDSGEMNAAVLSLQGEMDKFLEREGISKTPDKFDELYDKVFAKQIAGTDPFEDGRTTSPADIRAWIADQETRRKAALEQMRLQREQSNRQA